MAYVLTGTRNALGTSGSLMRSQTKEARNGYVITTISSIVTSMRNWYGHHTRTPHTTMFKIT